MSSYRQREKQRAKWGMWQDYGVTHTHTRILRIYFHRALPESRICNAFATIMLHWVQCWALRGTEKSQTHCSPTVGRYRRGKNQRRIGVLDVHPKVMPRRDTARIRKGVRCWAGGEGVRCWRWRGVGGVLPFRLIISGQRKNSEDY